MPKAASAPTTLETEGPIPTLRGPGYSQSLERGLAILRCFTPDRPVRKYRLGLRVTDLGMSALNSTGLREHAHSYLEELRQRTSYTVNLAVLDGGDILYVDRARSFRRGQSKIEEVRDAGFAVNNQEFAPELHSTSAPVRNEAREVVAAVNMAAHSSMISLEELVDPLGPHLVSTADRISARLGYRRNDESP